MSGEPLVVGGTWWPCSRLEIEMLLLGKNELVIVMGQGVEDA